MLRNIWNAAALSNHLCLCLTGGSIRQQHTVQTSWCRVTSGPQFVLWYEFVLHLIFVSFIIKHHTEVSLFFRALHQSHPSSVTLSTSVRWLISMADSRLYTWLNKMLFCGWACNANAKKKKKSHPWSHSHAWMTGGPLLWHPSSASVLRNSSETTSALCCLPHWIRCNLHIAATVPQTMLLPSPCILLSPTWKTRTHMWGCCLWTTAPHSIP